MPNGGAVMNRLAGSPASDERPRRAQGAEEARRPGLCALTLFVSLLLAPPASPHAAATTVQTNGSPEVAYDAACARARAGDLDDAVRLLEEANRLGFTDAAYAATDADLSALQRHPGFDTFLQRLRKSARA